MFASSGVRKRTGFALTLISLIAAVQASAATIHIPDARVPNGSPIAQNFLDEYGNNLSLLATEDGVSCVASQVLHIATSVYTGANGVAVDVKDVIRSPAASVQAIAGPGSTISFRIQLKYSPDPTKPITLTSTGISLDVSSRLEPSTDSLWITGGDAQTLANTLKKGETPSLSATSGISGRKVTDQIMSPDLVGLDACQVLLQDLLSAQNNNQEISTSGIDALPTATAIKGIRQFSELATTKDFSGITVSDAVSLTSAVQQPLQPVIPTAVAGVRLEFTARPDPETRVSPSTLENCRMRNIPEKVYLGRLRAVTGFFSQTQDVYVAFDDRGRLHRAYIPGIFDAEFGFDGGSARLSIAANTNVPDQLNTVKGCIGDAPLEASVCTITEEGSDRYTIAECGVLGTSETREELQPYFPDPTVFFSDTSGRKGPNISSTVSTTSALNSLIDFNQLGGEFSVLPNRINFNQLGGDSSVLPNLFTTPGSTGGGAGDQTGGGGGSQGGNTDVISPVPLPSSIWLMLGGLAMLFGRNTLLRRRENRLVSHL